MFKFYLFALILVAPPAFATDPIRPDPTLTPGVVHQPPTPLVTLCQPGYTKTVRDVPDAVKQQVLREYGYDPKTVPKGSMEIDHLVSLEIDGSNDIKNLWPQSYVTQPLNAHRKDVLENTLHRMVCRHEIDLATAQHEIITDWVAAYQKYVVSKGVTHE